MITLVLYGVLGGLLLLSGIAAFRLRFAYRHFMATRITMPQRIIDDLPSVSVCIPARNEGHAMTECLERVIANTYPKLEIIVINDSSGDNTSSLIKAFARDGVRFVEGRDLPEGWLGKTHALQQLANEASGTYVLFMDVDARIEPDTIERLVGYAANESAAMISVLPRRADGWRLSMFFSTLRYFWELLFHSTDRPATASSVWMIDRTLLHGRFQNFESNKIDIQPETKFAAALMQTNQYRFLISDANLGVAYEKKWYSQIGTSTRLLFPQLHKQVLRSLMAFIVLVAHLVPFVLIVIGLYDWTMLTTIAAIVAAINIALYASYLHHVRAHGWWIGMLLWPFIVAQEAVVVIRSMIQYGRGSVTWKNRPVTTKPLPISTSQQPEAKS